MTSRQQTCTTKKVTMTTSESTMKRAAQQHPSEVPQVMQQLRRPAKTSGQNELDFEGERVEGLGEEEEEDIEHSPKRKCSTNIAVEEVEENGGPAPDRPERSPASSPKQSPGRKSRKTETCSKCGQTGHRSSSAHCTECSGHIASGKHGLGCSRLLLMAAAVMGAGGGEAGAGAGAGAGGGNELPPPLDWLDDRHQLQYIFVTITKGNTDVSEDFKHAKHEVGGSNLFRRNFFEHVAASEHVSHARLDCFATPPHVRLRSKGTRFNYVGKFFPAPRATAFC